MTDIYQILTVNVAEGEGAWLYRTTPQGPLFGPFSKAELADKLIHGDITVQTLVGKEGTEFLPLQQVAAFHEFMPAARKAAAARARKKFWKIFSMVAALALVALAVGTLLFKRRYAEQAARELAAQAALDLQAESEKLAAKKDIPALDLVPVVQLSTEAEVHIKRPPPPPAAAPKHRHKLSVQSCSLSGADILRGMGAHVGAMNACVQAEKRRHAILPPVLKLSFVVEPAGTVGDFQIADAVLSGGVLQGCLQRVFATMRFGASKGACPVTIPIKIGKAS